MYVGSHTRFSIYRTLDRLLHGSNLSDVRIGPEGCPYNFALYNIYFPRFMHRSYTLSAKTRSLVRALPSGDHLRPRVAANAKKDNSLTAPGSVAQIFSICPDCGRLRGILARKFVQPAVQSEASGFRAVFEWSPDFFLQIGFRSARHPPQGSAGAQDRSHDCR